MLEAGVVAFCLFCCCFPLYHHSALIPNSGLLGTISCSNSFEIKSNVFSNGRTSRIYSYYFLQCFYVSLLHVLQNMYFLKLYVNNQLLQDVLYSHQLKTVQKTICSGSNPKPVKFKRKSYFQTSVALESNLAVLSKRNCSYLQIRLPGPVQSVQVLDKMLIYSSKPIFTDNMEFIIPRWHIFSIINDMPFQVLQLIYTLYRRTIPLQGIYKSSKFYLHS